MDEGNDQRQFIDLVSGQLATLFLVKLRAQEQSRQVGLSLPPSPEISVDLWQDMEHAAEVLVQAFSYPGRHRLSGWGPTHLYD